MVLAYYENDNIFNSLIDNFFSAALDVNTWLNYWVFPE